MRDVSTRLPPLPYSITSYDHVWVVAVVLFPWWLVSYFGGRTVACYRKKSKQSRAVVLMSTNRRNSLVTCMMKTGVGLISNWTVPRLFPEQHSGHLGLMLTTRLLSPMNRQTALTQQWMHLLWPWRITCDLYVWQKTYCLTRRTHNEVSMCDSSSERSVVFSVINRGSHRVSRRQHPHNGVPSSLYTVV